MDGNAFLVTTTAPLTGLSEKPESPVSQSSSGHLRPTAAACA